MTVKDFIIVPVRMVMTAYCFFQFAVQVLWLSKWQMPRILKANQGQADPRKKALYAAHRHVLFYLKTLHFLDIVKISLEGEPSQQPCVVIANHPGLLDFIIFLKDYPNAVCLYKSQSLENPVLSSFVQVAGYIEGMDGTSVANRRIIASCCERLNEGHQVVLFPEGTRSPDALSVRKFRTTGFHAVIKSRAPVQPVAIHYQPLLLGKGQRWVEFCRGRTHMTVRYLPIVHTEDLSEEKRTAAGLAEAVHKGICDALVDMAAKQGYGC